MKVIQQKVQLKVQNNDEHVIGGGGEKGSKHGDLFPSTIRCLIVGPSNCGKTNVMLTLIEHPHGLKFQHICLYSKSLHQPKYRYLETLLKPIKGITFEAFANGDDIEPPNKAKPNSIFIFDDVICNKQDIMREFFSMGRHNQVDCFYLAQSYAKIPKNLIRENANIIILFKQDEMSLKHAYTDHIGSTDFPFDKFKQVCSMCWQQPYSFISIFKDSELNKGRFRKGFDEFININE